MVTCKLLNGDCLEMLKTLPDASVHAVVTDPPAGIAFMGKEWDEDKGGRDEWIAWLAAVMRECRRVLKPGGHALVWALPRTSHWTGMALEDAGFEVRDSLHHIFGSGFPKSLSVSKAIDKDAGAVREVVGTYKGASNIGKGSTNSYIAAQVGTATTVQITAPATEAAKQWDGWGTALKPSHEVWWLARKPLAGTVAANVQEHGTGALNIDGCRVGFQSEADKARAYVKNATTKQHGGGAVPDAGSNSPRIPFEYEQNAAGRWPPNLLLSHTPDCTEDGDCADTCAVAEMDRQSGLAAPKESRTGRRGGTRGWHGAEGFGNPDQIKTWPADPGGGASRFFPVFRYEPKAASADKEHGLEYRGNDKRGNTHPTPKPTALMEWLIRLITPPGGTVLDPFMGSGTTGVAATKLGCGFVGCEREREYFEIAQARIGATPLPK